MRITIAVEKVLLVTNEDGSQMVLLYNTDNLASFALSHDTIADLERGKEIIID